MHNKSEEILKQISDATYDQLIRKIVYKLKVSSQEFRLMPDIPLKNLWEEICVQKQSDPWDGWIYVDHYIESVCFSFCEALPEEMQLALSYFLTEEEEEALIYLEGMADELKIKLYEVAINYSNSRIENYIYNYN